MIPHDYSDSVSVLRWLALPLLALTSACATTSTINKATQLADAGVAYGDTLVTLTNVTESTYIDWNSRSLLTQLKNTEALRAKCGRPTGTSACDQLPAEIQSLSSNLDKKDKAVRTNVELFDLRRNGSRAADLA